MGRKWVNRETDANTGLINGQTYGLIRVDDGKRWIKACCVKVAGGPKKRTQIECWRRGGWISESGSVEASKRAAIEAKCQQKIARLASRGRKRREKGERERDTIGETEREDVKGGVGRFVPAWLPSLGWWAIAAMRAPIATEWRGRDRVPAMHRLCTLTMHRLCTITRS